LVLLNCLEVVIRANWRLKGCSHDSILYCVWWRIDVMVCKNIITLCFRYLNFQSIPGLLESINNLRFMLTMFLSFHLHWSFLLLPVFLFQDIINGIGSLSWTITRIFFFHLFLILWNLGCFYFLSLAFLLSFTFSL